MSWLRRRDMLGGLLCVGIGVAALLLLAKLRMGSVGAMGPGFAPVWLARLLVFFGGIIFIKGLFDRETVTPQVAALRPLLAVLGGIVFFAVALAPLGLALTGFLLLLGAAAASRDFRPLEAVLVAVIGTALACALFVVALNLNISMWPA